MAGCAVWAIAKAALSCSDFLRASLSNVVDMTSAEVVLTAVDSAVTSTVELLLALALFAEFPEEDTLAGVGAAAFAIKLLPETTGADAAVAGAGLKEFEFCCFS